MASHFPFAVNNRVFNPPVKALLASRFHRALSGRMALITVTGRRSGREFTLPVLYEQDGDIVKVHVFYPAGKLWWRNLRNGGAPVRMKLRGVEYTGHAQAHGDEQSGVAVHVRLDGLSSQ